MKLKSLYEFQREYFNYPRSRKVYYGRAVSDMTRLVREAMENKSFLPFCNYLLISDSNKITKEMINKFLTLLKGRFNNSFNGTQYFCSIIDIKKIYITTRHRGIQVPLECIIDKKNKELIILVYGSNYDMERECSVLKGLIKEFEMPAKLPFRPSKLVYWNLSRGCEDSIDFKSIAPADKKSLIDAANRIE